MQNTHNTYTHAKRYKRQTRMGLTNDWCRTYLVYGSSAARGVQQLLGQLGVAVAAAASAHLQYMVNQLSLQAQPTLPRRVGQLECSVVEGNWWCEGMGQKAWLPLQIHTWRTEWRLELLLKGGLAFAKVGTKRLGYPLSTWRTEQRQEVCKRVFVQLWR